MTKKEKENTEVIKLKAELCDVLLSIDQAKMHIQQASQRAQELLKDIQAKLAESE